MTKSARLGAVLVFGVFGVLGAAGCNGNDNNGDDNPGDDQPPVVRLDRTDLVSDQQGAAARTDPDLVNAWGIAYGPDTAFWIADAGTEKTSVFDGDGKVVLPAIMLGGEVTGVVHNFSRDQLVITANQQSAPAKFVYATTGGQLIGWSDDVAPTAGVVAYDGSAAGAVYTGLAITGDVRGMRLYAANFAQARVDVFDADFAPVKSVAGMFVDPTLPAGYAPFGIQALDGLIYVTYAQQDADDPEEEVPGPGLGMVNVFASDGRFIRRFATAGDLNAPWAVARAPGEFGRFADAILIGNFGDGRITAINESDERVIGQLDHDGVPIAIEGLWGMVAGNDDLAGRSDTLYFAAGPGDEAHGLFGRISPTITSGMDGSGGTTGGGGGGGGGGGY